MDQWVPQPPDLVELDVLRFGDPAAQTRFAEQRLTSGSFEVVAATSKEHGRQEAFN